MSPLEIWLTNLQDDPNFKALYNKLKQHRPTIPPYNGDNTEKWKTESGRQQGFDLCLSLMKIDIGENK